MSELVVHPKIIHRGRPSGSLGIFFPNCTKPTKGGHNGCERSRMDWVWGRHFLSDGQRSSDYQLDRIVP